MHLEVGGHLVLTLSFTIFRKVGSFPSVQVAISVAIPIGTEVNRITTSKTLQNSFHFCAVAFELIYSLGGIVSYGIPMMVSGNSVLSGNLPLSR